MQFGRLSAFFVFFAISTSCVAQNGPECVNTTITLTGNSQPFVINSSTTDLSPKFCRYTFIVDKYTRPTVSLQTVSLQNDDAIFVSQHYKMGGFYYNYGGSTNLTSFDLTPTNFNIDLYLNHRNAQESFSVTVTVIDVTPSISKQWSVGNDLAEIIDADQLVSNTTIVLRPYQPQDLTVRYIEFSDFVKEMVLPYIYVYDGDTFVGTVYDMLALQNISQAITGSALSFLNTQPSSDSNFALLVSADYGSPGIQGTVVLRKMPTTNATETYTATNGQTIFHVISDKNQGTTIPSTVIGIDFRGEGVLTIYAGCSVTATDARRIATITTDTAQNFVPLKLHSRCRTLILSRGIVNLRTMRAFYGDPHVNVGQQGVIMSNDFPLSDPDSDKTSNYLLQAMDSQLININYEFASFDPSSLLKIDVYKKNNQKDSSTYSQAQKPPASVDLGPSYQQMTSYQVPKGSVGFLVRYTIEKATKGSLTASFGIVFVTMIIKLII
ncbi:unnamed protein product [Caenorhabditis auriculariae]|uniref:CUB-like domain-containing protein n=1 Tax=Caenorhabditis auriculariae TaxID=2777116 RepID=A0A8S1HI04_9PELO|nr:unnamed protein product [Caenorhabditis auriculariae]